MNNTFNGLISRLDMAKEAISEFKDMSEKFSQTKMQTEKGEKNIQELCDNYTLSDGHLNST